MSKKKFGEAHYTIFRKIHFENFGEFWKSGKNSKVFRAHKIESPHFFFKQGNDAFLWKKQMLFFCKNFKIISFCTWRKWNPKPGRAQAKTWDSGETILPGLICGISKSLWIDFKPEYLFETITWRSHGALDSPPFLAINIRHRQCRKCKFLLFSEDTSPRKFLVTLSFL